MTTSTLPWDRGRSNTKKTTPSSGGFVDRHPGSGGSGQQSAFSSSYVPSPKFGGSSSSWSPAAGSKSNNSIKKSNTVNNSKMGGWHPGVGSDDKKNNTVTGTTWPGASHAGAGSWSPGVGSNNNKSNNTIVVHNDDGDEYKGNTGSKDDSNWEFGSITTKNNTYLNTEDEEVIETYKKINQLKLLNPTWTDIDAANYLNYGTTDRKHDGKRGKRPNAGSEDILKDGLMNTWGMGIRGDYNFGKAMDVGSYSNGLDWVSANPNGMSAEDIKIQRAILDETKKYGIEIILLNGRMSDKSFKSSGDAYGGITGIIAKLGTGGNVKGQANQKEKG